MVPTVRTGDIVGAGIEKEPADIAQGLLVGDPCSGAKGEICLLYTSDAADE